MVSIARSFPHTTSGRPEPPHYHVLLSAVLQLRFGHLCKMTFLILWGLGALVSLRQSIFFALFPFLGILLFVSIFPIYVLRKARLHVDVRPQPSLAIEIWRRLVCKGFIRVSLVYLFSSFTLSQIYCLHFAGLAIFLPKRDFELYQLNERRSYVMALSFYLAVVYAAIHCLFDRDLVHLTQRRVDPMTRVKSSFYIVFMNTLRQTVLFDIIFIFVYIIIRPTVWKSSLYITRLFVTMHRSNLYTSYPFIPLHTFFFSYALLFFWNFGNDMFTIYMTLGALHRGKGISEKSSDKNGTLVTGLRSSKRPFTRCVAFQELCIIAHGDGKRRDSIYRDIENPSIWQQITHECLFLLTDLQNKLKPRGDSYSTIKPTSTKQNGFNTVSTTNSPPPESPSPPPIRVRRENIFLPSANSSSSPATKLERRLLDGLQDPQATQSTVAIEKFQSLQNQYRGVKYKLWMYITTFLKSPYGAPFRCTVQRKVSKLVANQEMISEAISALSDFVVFSIQEDTYGIVQRDIPQILSNFDRTITIIEAYIRRPDLHWSDVANQNKLVNGINNFESESYIELDELDIILDDLKSGFDHIVRTFERYLLGMGLSSTVYRRCGIVVRNSN
ncbi:nucleoporin protein Ndc1-Nup [Dipodascopsis uninucleata]